MKGKGRILNNAETIYFKLCPYVLPVQYTGRFKTEISAGSRR